MDVELCGDGYCRDCHHGGATWDQCTSETWSVRILLKLGHKKEELRALYPEAFDENGEVRDG